MHGVGLDILLASIGVAGTLVGVIMAFGLARHAQTDDRDRDARRQWEERLEHKVDKLTREVAGHTALLRFFHPELRDGNNP